MTNLALFTGWITYSGHITSPLPSFLVENELPRVVSQLSLIFFFSVQAVVWRRRKPSSISARNIGVNFDTDVNFG